MDQRQHRAPSSEGRGATRESAARDCRRCEIRHLAFCGALDVAHLDDIQAIMQMKTLRPGEHVINEGDDAEAVFNVVAGCVKLYKLLPDGRCQITGFLLPGDFCGIVTDGTYAYSAAAIESAEICSMSRRKLETVFARHPELERRLLAMVSHELSAAQEQMLLLGRKTAIERVAAFLLNLSSRSARIGWPEDPVHLPMTRADIADYLGLTIETVSRTITALKKDGLIQLRGTDEIAIPARKRLAAVAAGEGAATRSA
jgi:CRP/FNR family transcriptional regulator